MRTQAVRTLQVVVIMLLLSAFADGVDGQAPLPGAPPRPAELIDPGGGTPLPPAPGPFVPPGSSQYAPPADTQTVPANDRLAPSYAQPSSDQSMPGYGGQTAPATHQPPDISPNNPEKWRYVFRNGGWWYYTPTKQWMYWSDGRWVEYARPAVSNTSSYVQPPVYRRPRVRFGMGVGAGAYPYGPTGSYGYGGVGVY